MSLQVLTEAIAFKYVFEKEPRGVLKHLKYDSLQKSPELFNN